MKTPNNKSLVRVFERAIELQLRSVIGSRVKWLPWEAAARQRVINKFFGKKRTGVRRRK